MTTFFDRDKKHYSNVYYDTSRRSLRCKFEIGDTVYVQSEGQYQKTKITNMVVTNTLVYYKTECLEFSIEESRILTEEQWLELPS